MKNVMHTPYRFSLAMHLDGEQKLLKIRSLIPKVRFTATLFPYLCKAQKRAHEDFAFPKEAYLVTHKQPGLNQCLSMPVSDKKIRDCSIASLTFSIASFMCSMVNMRIYYTYLYMLFICYLTTHIYNLLKNMLNVLFTS